MTYLEIRPGSEGWGAGEERVAVLALPATDWNESEELQHLGTHLEADLMHGLPAAGLWSSSCMAAAYIILRGENPSLPSSMSAVPRRASIDGPIRTSSRPPRCSRHLQIQGTLSRRIEPMQIQHYWRIMVSRWDKRLLNGRFFSGVWHPLIGYEMQAICARTWAYRNRSLINFGACMNIWLFFCQKWKISWLLNGHVVLAQWRCLLHLNEF